MTEVYRLDCQDCARSPDLKRSRGCGVPPVNLDTGEKWTPEAFIEECDEKGYSHASIGEEAKTRYLHAVKGNVWERSGMLWDCCPMFYYAFASPQAKVQAQRALKMRRARKAGDPLAAREGALTPYGLSLLNLADKYWSELEAEEQEKEAEAARRKAKEDAEKKRRGGR